MICIKRITMKHGEEFVERESGRGRKEVGRKVGTKKMGIGGNKW